VRLCGGARCGRVAPPPTFFCYACVRRHERDSAIGGRHARYDIEADAAQSPAQSHLREFYLQTIGIAAALQILGFDGVRIEPARFGRGWPDRAAVEARYRALAKRSHPDVGGDPEEFRKVQWAIEVVRRYRPPDDR